MKIVRRVLGPVQTNVYFVFEETSREGLIIDPADDAEEIVRTAETQGFTPKRILLTHGHFDHITAANEVAAHYRIPIYALLQEEKTLEDPERNGDAQFFRRGISVKPDYFLKDGEELSLLGTIWRVIWTPGHTAGSCCFYLPEKKLLFSGDTLFRTSYGRFDLPGGDFSALYRSITERLFSLPDDVVVLPGHMEETTIGFEKRCNPILDF